MINNDEFAVIVNGGFVWFQNKYLGRNFFFVLFETFFTRFSIHVHLIMEYIFGRRSGSGATSTATLIQHTLISRVATGFEWLTQLTNGKLCRGIFAHLRNDHVVHRPLPRIVGFHVPYVEIIEGHLYRCIFAR